MTIAIDLSPLDSAHRMRGIGYTLINIIDNISSEARKGHKFIFFLPPGAESVLKLLKLDGINYDIRLLQDESNYNRKRSKKKLQILGSLYSKFIDLRKVYFGDAAYGDLSDIDVFLQTDQSKYLPNKRGVKKILIIYDIIPFVLEWEYLWSYETARLRGYRIRSAVRCHVRRILYAHQLRIKSKRADKLIAISECTREDFIEKLGIHPDKIQVATLGINLPDAYSKAPSLVRYIPTSWDYSPRHFKFNSSDSYILYIGGADSRRKIKDLVCAFNHLKAEGHKLKLVLAGDSMQGPLNISTIETQLALSNSSYLEDIIFMGFVDDSQRDWLYANALALVFPSKYEGFGLPVLEAMIHRCPVIAYENKAVREVAHDYPIYAKDYKGIMQAVTKLLETPQDELENIRNLGYAHAKKYDWRNTTKKILNALEPSK